jgi:hypothetical protein
VRGSCHRSASQGAQLPGRCAGQTHRGLERAGPDAEEIIAGFGPWLLHEPGFAARFQADLDQRAQFNPVLRFVLSDPERRTFRLQRRCYLGSMGDWIEVRSAGWSSLDELVERAVPCLGTGRFFELY